MIEMKSDLVAAYSMSCRETGLADVIFTRLQLEKYRSQGRIKAGADGAAAPGPQPKIGPPLF